MADAPAEPPRVLVVDDEPDIQRLVVFNLEKGGFDVKAVDHGAAVLPAVQAFRPHVVVLDLMLPDVPGVEVCRQLRECDDVAQPAVLMLTARGDEYDRVLGFEVGTDDYVVKPFSPRELVHRVRALLKRSALFREQPRTAPPVSSAGRQPLRWRELTLDAVSHRVTIEDRELALRPLEFRLLQLFLENPEAVLSRAQLLSEAWGITAQVNTRTVDTHVRRLREALGPLAEAIETVYGVGYRLRPP